MVTATEPAKVLTPSAKGTAKPAIVPDDQRIVIRGMSF
jgi:hypothetical protein